MGRETLQTSQAGFVYCTENLCSNPLYSHLHPPISAALMTQIPSRPMIARTRQNHNTCPLIYTRAPNCPIASPIIVLVLLPLHTHLPSPQRLRQPACKTGLTTRLTGRGVSSAAAAPVRTRHADCAVSSHGHRKRRRFPAARNRSFCRRGWGCGFGSHGRSGGGSGASVHAVGYWRRKRHRSGGLWWRRRRRRSFFFQVSGGGPALGGAIELFGEPPACDELLIFMVY